MSVNKDKKYSILSDIDERDVVLVRSIAKLMKRMNWSTSMREDAYDVIRRVKVDKHDAMLQFGNLETFLRLMIEDIRRIKKEFRHMDEE